MSNTLTIRRATREDAPLVLEFIRELAEYEKLAQEVTATGQQLRETLFGKRAFAEVIIAFAEGKPAGFAVFLFTYSTFRAQPVLYLEDLFVKPELRGGGIGKALFQHLIELAHREGCGRLEWSVLEWNQAAIDFYEGLGAKPRREWVKFRLDQEQIRALAGGRAK